MSQLTLDAREPDPREKPKLDWLFGRHKLFEQNEGTKCGSIRITIWH
jgi:hypothetical protein